MLHKDGVLMPVYEYICKDCNRKFDALVPNLSVADSTRCRHCSGHNLRRVVSSFAMIGGVDDSVIPVQSSSGGCCGGSCGCGH